MLSVDGGQESLVVLRVGGSASSKWALGSGGDLVTQSCPTLCESVARQAPLSMWILQGRIPEWVALPSSRGSSQPRDGTQISYVFCRFFATSAIWEAL